MDWGFVKVNTPDGGSYQCACFAMICHHCGERYIEFFPNARQETLFIGMIHAFIYMGIPENVLTDNMKRVVIGRYVEQYSRKLKKRMTHLRSSFYQICVKPNNYMHVFTHVLLSTRQHLSNQSNFPVVKGTVGKFVLSQNTLVKETVGKNFSLVKDRVGKFCCC